MKAKTTSKGKQKASTRRKSQQDLIELGELLLLREIYRKVRSEYVIKLQAMASSLGREVA